MSELHHRAADAPEPASAAPERATPDRRADDDQPDTPGTLRSHTEFASEKQDRDAEPEKDRRDDKPGGDRNARLTVDGTPLHEYLDPIGAGARDNTIGDQPSDKRTGDHIAEADSDRASKLDSFRKNFYKDSSKFKSSVQEYGKPVDGPRHLPTGHAGVDTRPTMVNTPSYGPSLPSLAIGATAFSMAVYETGRKIVSNMSNRKRPGDAG